GYNLTTWTATSMTGLTGRRYLPGIWTGAGAMARFTVWGGETTGGASQTGARYNPMTNVWSATTNSGRPAARSRQIGVSTGSIMIVWGGWTGTAVRNDGSRYDPIGDTWSAVAGAPGGFVGRVYATGIWAT